MPTRGAAKREAAFLAEASLSSPPITPAVNGKAATTKAKGKVRGRGKDPSVSKEVGDEDDGISRVEEDDDTVQLPSPAEDGEGMQGVASPIGGKKRRRAPPKTKKTTVPVTGGWDVLPHGLGKKGDLVDGTVEAKEMPVAPPKKRSRKGRAKEEFSGEDDVMLEVEMVKTEAQDEGNDMTAVEAKDEDKTSDMGSTNYEVISRSKLSVPEPKAELEKRGLPKSGKKADLIARLDKDTDPITTELLEDIDMDKDAKVEDSKDDRSKNKLGRKVNVVKNEDIDMDDVKDEDFKDEMPKKKRAPRKRAAVDTSDNVLQKVDEIIDASGKAPKAKKGKANPYGLTPGYSPFPDFDKPTPEDCDEVTRLLSKLHGEVKPPDVIPPPSMEVTGCGEVPDLLDAILRTLLSASTTAKNSNMALAGLKDRFGLRTSGIGEGSVNWEAVHAADLNTVIDSIKSGGLAKIKGTNIKKILDVVWKRNLARRDALVKEKETGITAGIPGAKYESQEAKNLEIAKVNDNMLSMDYVFELTTDEAMTEMTKLPGIGVKTASCVILFCMKRPSFAVDTHVWRHCKWLGWVPASATRDQTFSHCEVRVPDHLKYPLHQLFLRHGKTCGRCRAATSADSNDYKNAECPIDHLMTRTEKKKMLGAKPAAATAKPKGRKGGKKTKDDDTEESEAEMSEPDESDDNDDVDGVEVSGEE